MQHQTNAVNYDNRKSFCIRPGCRVKALANGVSNGFSRKEIIKKYRLESSANVQSVKKSLLKKGIIDIDEQTVTFDDSIFKLWMQRQRF